MISPRRLQKLSDCFIEKIYAFVTLRYELIGYISTERFEVFLTVNIAENGRDATAAA
jgi:hypothetical protein